jgi:hypothetical protein
MDGGTSTAATAEWTVQQSAAFLETVRHIGTRLTGTTDMIAEALLNSGELTSSQKAYENLQPVLRDLFRRNLAAEVMVGLYKVAAVAAGCEGRSAAAQKVCAREQKFIDAKHDVSTTIEQGRETE